MNILLLLCTILLSFSGVLFAYRLGKPMVYAYLGAHIAFALCALSFFVDVFLLPLAFMEVTYATWFLVTDILSENDGPKEARKLVWMTCFIFLIFTVIAQLMIHMSPHAFDGSLVHLTPLFAPLPRIIAAGVITFVAEQMFDIWLFHKIKIATKGKCLWLRNCLSTAVTQGIDVLVFYPLAFAGVVENIPLLMLAGYLFKVSMAVLDTPFVYLSKKMKMA